MRAVNRADAARHAAGPIAGKDMLELLFFRTAQVRLLPLVYDERGQTPCGLGDRGARQPSVLIGAVVGLAVAQHTERCHQILDRVRLLTPGRVDGSAPPRLVAHCRVATLEDRTWHAMPLFSILLSVDSGLATDPKVVAQDGVRSQIKISVAIDPAAGPRAPQRPLAHGSLLQSPPHREGGSGPESHPQVEVCVNLHVLKKAVFHTAAVPCSSAGDTRPGAVRSIRGWEILYSRRRGEGRAGSRRRTR